MWKLAVRPKESTGEMEWTSPPLNRSDGKGKGSQSAELEKYCVARYNFTT